MLYCVNIINIKSNITLISISKYMNKLFLSLNPFFSALQSYYQYYLGDIDVKLKYRRPFFGSWRPIGPFNYKKNIKE